MPGLLRGIARTAVVAGTATAVSNRVSRRQSERWAEEDDERYGAPAADEGPDQLEQLKQLGELKASGVLTEEEFAAQKAKILGS
jgi:hypothetical protein